MPGLPLTLTCADYARVMPLATGAVRPEGVALELVLGRGGSWDMRAQMLRRALHDPDVHGGSVDGRPSAPGRGRLSPFKYAFDAMVNLISITVAR